MHGDTYHQKDVHNVLRQVSLLNVHMKYGHRMCKGHLVAQVLHKGTFQGPFYRGVLLHILVGGNLPL